MSLTEMENNATLRTHDDNGKSEETVKQNSIYRNGKNSEHVKDVSISGSLNKEVLKAHNATEIGVGALPRRMRERAATIVSESSAATGTAKKLMRLRHKIKLFGGSFSKSGSDNQIVKQYENTYKTEPDQNTKFSVKKAEDIIKDVLEGNLNGKSYDPKRIPNICKCLAELIKERIKACEWQRYKVIAHVLILENQGQSMRHVSRCLWNKDLDNHATATYETDDFTAVGSVFVTYYE